jgi:hypothetical protein
MRALDCHCPWDNYLGDEVSVIPETLFGTKRLAVSNAEPFHGLAARGFLKHRVAMRNQSVAEPVPC